MLRWLILFLLATAPYYMVNAENKNTLQIKLHNLKNNKGQAVAMLYRPEDNVMKKAFRIVKANIVNRKVSLAFKGLSYGDYAVIAYHDQNNNGKLDHNIFRFPKEPMVFSGRYQLKLFAGRPTFSNLKFSFKKQHTQLVLIFSSK